MAIDNDSFKYETLNRFAVAMLDAADLDDLLWSIAENVGKLLGFDDCVIYLRDDDVMVQMAACGIKSSADRKVFKRIEIRVGDGIVGTVAETGIAELVLDTKKDSRYIHDQFSGLSELTVPVIFGGEIIAVIDSEASTKYGFTEVDREQLQMIANIASSRIASAKYLRSLQATQKDLEKANAELEQNFIDLKLNQQSLIHSEKMASVGQLAAGIAHEINNPLGYSLSNMSTLKEYVAEIRDVIKRVLVNADDPDKVKEIVTDEQFEYLLNDMLDLVDETTEGLNSAKNIVTDLRGFARSSGDNFVDFDVNQGLSTTLNVLRNEIRYHCKVETDFGDLPMVDCNPGKLNQVFANIILNASQSSDEQIDINICTYEQNSYAIIEIGDNGPGIAAEHLAHIFTPFYTTKPVGTGTGLGLSISYQIIVEQHHGKLEVNSCDAGTRFKISIPLHQEKVE